MFDLKVINAVLDQLEEERGVPKAKVIDAIQEALAAAYKKEYGKRGQIVRAIFDPISGATIFEQVKIVVDPTTVVMPEEGEEEIEEVSPTSPDEDSEAHPKYNPEQHILIEDARRIKRNVDLGDEIAFPLEDKEVYGRISAQTAKQVIIQKIREAEKISVFGEFEDKQGDVVSGVVQRVERGNVFIDLGRATGIMPHDEQIPGERYRPGERIRALLFNVEEGQRGIYLRLSRSHPEFLRKLFEAEAPEVANGTVEIKSIAREAGARSKIAVFSNDEYIDPVGACVGQRGVRVSTVTSELGGEKIDVVEYSDDPKVFVEEALSPARTISVDIDEENRVARVTVSPDQQSLAIGKGGQNARLAAKLTGWKIDIVSTEGPEDEKEARLAGAVSEDEALDFADAVGDNEEEEIADETLRPEENEEDTTELVTGDEERDEEVAREALEDNPVEEEVLQENVYSSNSDEEEGPEEQV